MRDFGFVPMIKSLLCILYQDSFFALQGAKAALWLMEMEWPSPGEPGACQLHGGNSRCPCC